jgi:hypothetical protein
MDADEEESLGSGLEGIRFLGFVWLKSFGGCVRWRDGFTFIFSMALDFDGDGVDGGAGFSAWG